MPTQRPFRACGVIDRPRSDLTPGAERLPAELERRITAIEAHSAAADFDAVSWAWMLLLGVALPAVLLVVGWVL